jgi:hypothetical protein
MAEAAALHIVEGRIRAELGRERAAGQPLKAAFHAVARRLGMSPRRVRAFHHQEVEAGDVTAAELLAADARYRAEIADLVTRLETLRGLMSGEEMADAPGDAPAGVLARPRGTRPAAGGSLGCPPAPLARLVMERGE